MLSNIEPLALIRKAATDKLVEKIVKYDSLPIQPDILNPPLLRLSSRKSLWLDLQPGPVSQNKVSPQKVSGGMDYSIAKVSREIVVCEIKYPAG